MSSQEPAASGGGPIRLPPPSLWYTTHGPPQASRDEGGARWPIYPTAPPQPPIYPPGGGPFHPSPSGPHGYATPSASNSTAPYVLPPITHSTSASASAGPSHRAPSPPIDPALVPLPEPQTIEPAELRRFSPVSKATASRSVPKSRKDKGKTRSSTPKVRKEVSRKLAQSRKQRSAGRPLGATNYTEEQMIAFLDIVEEILPVGAKGWTATSSEYEKLALKAGWPTRSAKSLEKKFKQLVQTKKPTGDATIPFHVERAKFLDSLICEKCGTRELDDADIDDAFSSDNGGADSDSEDTGGSDEDKPAPATKPSAPVARAVKIEQPLPPPSTRRSRATTGIDVLNRISENLNPAAQTARDNLRAERSFQTTQIISLNDQIRDQNMLISSLRDQISQAQLARHEAERRADRAEQRLEMNEMLQAATGPGVGRSRTHRGRNEYPYLPTPSHGRRGRSPSPAFARRDMYEVTFSQGGGARYFATAEEADELKLFESPMGDSLPRFSPRTTITQTLLTPERISRPSGLRREAPSASPIHTRPGRSYANRQRSQSPVRRDAHTSRNTFYSSTQVGSPSVRRHSSSVHDAALGLCGLGHDGNTGGAVPTTPMEWSPSPSHQNSF